jgi:hypothetical protein
MTSEITSESALSTHEATDALGALRQKQTPQATQSQRDTEQPEEQLPPDAEGDVTDVVDETAEPEADSESEPQAEEVVKLTLPDGETINADEAVKGYLRQSDYTRKTQQISQAEKQRQEEYGREIQRLREVYDSLPQEQEPDWISLLDQIDPKEVQKAQLLWKRRVEAKQSAKAALETAQRQQLERAFQNTLEVLGSGQIEPSWKDPKKREEGLSTVVKYGQEHGLTREDLNLALTSPVAISFMEKARKWDALQASKPAAIKQTAAKPKGFAPGARPGGKATVSNAQTAIKRLQQTHSTDDAIAAIRALRRQA